MSKPGRKLFGHRIVKVVCQGFVYNKGNLIEETPLFSNRDQDRENNLDNKGNLIE